MFLTFFKYLCGNLLHIAACILQYLAIGNYFQSNMDSPEIHMRLTRDLILMYSRFTKTQRFCIGTTKYYMGQNLTYLNVLLLEAVREI